MHSLCRETEDTQSLLLKAAFKEYDQQRFREKIRLEVEERKAKERAEKEERRKAAEARRAAVVERIRKQAEMEERRKREAEEALQRIEEEKIRREREALERHLADQAQMVMEDNLSALAEQDFREQLERKLWKQREREKLVEWEKEQQKKDQLEEEQRKLRLAELEEKRKKLEQLRQMQQAGDSKANEEKLREEGNRINKQLRIQNRAKFVSKKMRATDSANSAELKANVSTAIIVEAPKPTAEADAQKVGETPAKSSTVDPVPGLNRTHSLRDLDVAIFKDNNNVDGGKKDSDSSSSPNKVKQEALTEATVVFLEKVQSSTSESELRAWQQEIMSEKRGLRLEQRQRASFEVRKDEHDTEIDRKLQELTVKGDSVSRRLEELIALADNKKAQQVSADLEIVAKQSHSEGKPPSSASLRKDQAASSASSSHGMMRGKEPQLSASSAAIAITSASVASADTSTFKKIESVLREAQRTLSILAGCKYDVNRLKEEDQSSCRNLTMLSMDIAVLLKEISPNNDPLGYIDKLKQITQDLNRAMKSIEQVQSGSNKTRPPSAGKGSVKAIVERPLSSSSHRPSGSIKQPKEESLLSSISTPIIHVSEVDGNGIPMVEVVEDGDDLIVEEGGEEGEAIEMEDPTKLPGWEECLYTSMFSAAHHAAYFGHVEVLKFLCRYFDCFIMDKKGRTPLFYAALANRLDCVVELVALDPQWVEVGDAKGDTPLHAAAISNGVQVLAFLLSCEVHPDTANFQGLTPSHLARSKEALLILQKAGAQLFCVDNQSRMPIWFACFEGRSDCADFLCEVTPKNFLLWPDNEGETCLHKASAQGHDQVVEVLCRHLPKMEDLYVLNKKQHTVCHVAANARVLQVLYEQGANLWVKDSKDRMPLFFASFFGRTDCIEMLVNLARTTNPSVSSSRPVSSQGRGSITSSRPGSAIKSSQKNFAVPEILRSRDIQGDTALHAACLCGHLSCAVLLSYYLRNEENNGKLRASDLAKKANHIHIARYVEAVEQRRVAGQSQEEIFGAGIDFPMYASFITYYGSRWMKAYDTDYKAYYYIDRITNASQWDRPDLFDMHPIDEVKFDKARELLQIFYEKYNPEKLKEMSDILAVYKDRYTELFITLANKYNVQDLSMFKGVVFD